MELDKIIEAAKGKELGSDVIDAIKALDTSGTVARLESELSAEQGKNKGILDDKHKFKTRAEAAEKTLQEQTDSKLPAEELHKKQLQEMEEKLAEGTRLREEQDKTFKAQTRDNALLKLGGAIKWAKTVPQGTRELLVKQAFTGTNDLSNESAVSEVVKSLTESHASFISADAPSGSGDKGKGGGAGDSDAPSTIAGAVESAWK